MKKIFAFVIISLLTVFQAQAVLKEKDLAQTLGVLRAELEQSYNEQQAMMEMYKKRYIDQHTALVQMMQQSNQIALMLYSQNTDFTFDMAYACQAATEQYHKLKQQSMPYNKMKERLYDEIKQYDALIQTLLNLPPRLLPNGELATAPDSIKALLPKVVLDTAHKSLYMLDEKGMADREACLEYANAIRDNLITMLENVERDQEHYERVANRVSVLNTYALEKYDHIQKSIFVNGGLNYFQMLKRFKRQVGIAKKDVNDKYKPFQQHSEWRGPVIMGISIFMLFYIVVASLLSYVIMRWLLPRKWRIYFADNNKRPFITLAFGVAIFAISISIARLFVTQNFVLMAIKLMIFFSWLMEVILVSLLIRLDDKQIRAGIRSYTPFVCMAFIIIVFRIILIPNNLVNLIYPPILLAFTIWQFVVMKQRITKLPDSDMIYTVVSLVAMVVSCVAAWFGYVLLAVQIMVWWTIQLAAIQTLTCFYDLAKLYESRQIPKKIAKANGEVIENKEDLKKQYKKLQPKMAKGEYIAQTWFYDFQFKALLPILAILSVPASIYWAANIFEMSSLCRKVFLYIFLNKPGIIQLSLFKICLVLELFFLFRYLNYAIKAFYQMMKKRKKKNDVRTQGNATLGNNVISILVWGLYVISAMMILEVSGKGISIVMAGLATGLGFAMKDLLENFVYGVILMTGRLRVGDYIECDGVQGKVESINYQSTQLVTLDGCVIAFQNATLFSKNFKNLTRNHGYVLVKVPVGVAYGVNVEKVRKMLIKGLEPLAVKNAAGKAIIDPKQGFSVLFNDFGDSSVDLFVVCWVLVEEKAGFIAKVKEVIYNTLNANNIEIPFPQRDVHIHNVEIPAPKPKARKTESQSPIAEPVVEEEAELEEVTTSRPKKRGRKPKKKEDVSE